MGTVYEQPTTMNRVVTAITKYITLTYFDNGAVYVYSYSTEKDLFTYTAGALNYNINKQQSTETSPNVAHVQIYEINAKDRTLTLLHDIEV